MSILQRGIASVFLIGMAAVASAEAPPIPNSHPTLWSTQPGIEAFENLENARLAKAGQLVVRITRAKAPSTVARTLADFDAALQQINAAVYFASDMEAVHPDAKFRDA